jgi:hypothetical protein
MRFFSSLGPPFIWSPPDQVDAPNLKTKCSSFSGVRKQKFNVSRRVDELFAIDNTAIGKKMALEPS